MIELTFEPARASGAYETAPQDGIVATAEGGASLGASDKALSPAELLDLILRSLEDDKAQDVVTIDLAGKSSMADSMVVASGRSHRHVSAIADHLQRRLKEAGLGKVRVEGLPQCDWVLIDAGDVIVHLFRPEVRAFYNLEKMWSGDIPEGADKP